MSENILVAYATRYGSTKEAAETVAATLRESGFAVDIKPAREVRTIAGYGVVILGAPLFMFHLHKDALRFLSRHQSALQRLKVAVFSLGPVHDPYDKEEWQSSLVQLRNELAKLRWFAPFALELFGGRYDPAKLRFPLSLFGGKVPASDLFDRTKISGWAAGLAEKL